MKLRDRVSIPNLLDLAKIPSVNAMVVKAVALEAWSCNRSTDGKDGARNQVGSIIFDKTKLETSRKMRAPKSDQVAVPLRRSNTFVAHSDNMWNTSEDLRSAESKTAARREAMDLAKLSPL
jgi:hypothetical protein